METVFDLLTPPRGRAAVWAVLLGVLGAGCTASPALPPAVYTVQGTVTWRGGPAPGDTEIYFVPEDGSPFSSNAYMVGEGCYRLRGIPAGAYHIHVRIPGPNREDLLLGSYGAGRTPLRIDVRRDEAFDIELK